MEQSERADLNHLLSFYWLAKTGSFTAAGAVLGLPKSTVSRQIRALEQRLQVRLVERTTRRLALTEIGGVYLGHCERVMAEAEDAERAVTAYSAEPRGLLRVGVPVTFARTYLAPMLPAFCAQYPDLRLDLVFRSGPIDPAEGLLDVVIHVGRLHDSSYVVRRLGAMGLAPYASPSYVARRGLPLAPAELAEHEVLTGSRSPRGARWRLQGPPGEVEVKLEPRLTVADPVVTAELVAAGVGIGVLPDFLTRGTALVRVLPEWRMNELEFFALYPERQMTAPKIRVFLDYLTGHLAL